MKSGGWKGLWLFVLTAALASAALDHPLDALQRAQEAYGRKDYVTFLRESERAAKLAPDYPPALYTLARAQALNGKESAAWKSLSRVIQIGGVVALGATDEKDFTGLRTPDRLARLQARLDTLRTPVTRSDIAFRIPERDLIPEGTAYDPVSRRLFVGSTYKRKIIGIDPDGTIRTFVDGKPDGLLGVSGLKVDSARRVLWAVSGSGASPVGRILDAQASDRWQTGVFKYDLSTGKLIRKYVLGPESGEHFFNDLAITPGGDAYVTDTQSGAVYVIRAAKEELEVFLGPEAGLRFANGIALLPGDRYLFVAHAVGIERIDLRSGERRPLTHPVGMTLAGVDGLSFFRGSLIAHQNVTLRSVNRYDLGHDGTRVTRKEVLDAHREEFNIPSTGAVAGDDYYYIANAQLRSFTDGKIWPMDRLREVIILKFTLARPAEGKAAR